MFCPNEPREARDNFVRSSPSSYPFRSYDDDLAASLDSHTTQRKRRSLVRRRRGRPDPAQKIKFSLCVTKSPPPPRRAAAFTFPSLQLSLCELWRGLRDSFTKLNCRLRHGRPGRGRGRSQSAPLSPLRHVVGTSVWPLFPRRNFRYRSEEREKRNAK